MVLTELLEQAGGAGLFQALQILTFFLFSVWVPFQLVVENFSAAVPGHRCWAHLLDNGSEAPANLSPEALLAVSIPPGPNHGAPKCLRFHHPQWQLLDPNATAANWSKADMEPCTDGWVYDRSAFTSTIVTEPLGQSIYMAEAMVGCIVCGFLSHRFGRKPVLSWCCLLAAAASISTVVAPSFPDYCGLRGPRPITMVILGSTYSISQMAVGGLAFTLRDWRTLQLAGSVPFFVIFLISWSLIIIGKPDQALQELKKVAKINGHKETQKTLTIEVLMSSMQEEVASAKSRQSVLDLFCLPVLRWRTCNQLVVQFFFGAVDLLARAIATFLLRFFGRRTTLASSLAGAGFTILVNELVPQDLQTLRVVFAVLGKACFGLNLTCIMIYKPALFPTSQRVPALPSACEQIIAEGFLRSAARSGSVMGPLLRTTHQVLPQLPPLSYGASPSRPASTSSSSRKPRAFHSLTPSRTWRDSERSAAARGGRQEVVITESTWF
ncbi:hypothetical protein FD755_011702 [Muntiacus reevesi]|uniref:Major facilitator superfamily (MFS) profile domain-containing protein n=1 Tax=Muntiacus reevesi TaxID=9886 RepID=A0A5N3XTP5_MUNRE|nr:hypothetical protein FD755_011702 [Muntiacus reevesi]